MTDADEALLTQATRILTHYFEANDLPFIVGRHSRQSASGQPELYLCITTRSNTALNDQLSELDSDADIGRITTQELEKATGLKGVPFPHDRGGVSEAIVSLPLHQAETVSAVNALAVRMAEKQKAAPASHAALVNGVDKAIVYGIDGKPADMQQAADEITNAITALQAHADKIGVKSMVDARIVTTGKSNSRVADF